MGTAFMLIFSKRMTKQLSNTGFSIPTMTGGTTTRATGNISTSSYRARIRNKPLRRPWSIIFTTTISGGWYNLILRDTADNPVIGLQGLEGVDNSVALIKGRRPVVYVGGWGEGLGGSGPGGHGSYPCHGPWYLVADLEFLGVPLGEGAKYDNPDGKGSILYDVPLTVLANASEYDYDVNPEMSWLKADLRFGHRYVDSPPLTRGDGNAAPEGPSYKETWRRTGMAGKDEYTFVNTTRLNFQHHFIKEDTRWSGDVLLIGDIVIDPGATLTIAPGTVITSDVGQDLHGMNDAARVDIVNYGEMTADASKGDSIVFRSNASVPSPGDWYGIRNYGVLTMKNCVIRDSRGSVEGYGTQTLENVRFVNNDTLSVPLISNIVASQNVAIKPKQVDASGGRRPYTYSLSGTSDLSISESGLITGIPTQTGTFTDTVTVTTAADETDLTSDSVVRSFTMTVYPQLTVKLISNSDTTATTLFIDATVDTSITPIQVYASGGKPPYQYSLSGDDVTNIAIDSPGGLTISITGLITGAPTQPGTPDFAVTVTDSNGTVASTSFVLDVSATPSPKPALPQLTISEISDVEDATQGVAIDSIHVSASGGRTPYEYSLSGSPNDNGIEISNGGRIAITGTPTQAGTYSYKVKVMDGDSGADSTSFTMRVSPPLTISEISNVAITLGESITIPVSASGGRTPYAYSLSGAPSNISISNSGLISGRPTQTGSFTNVRATVTDADGRTASTSSFTIRVSPPLEPPPTVPRVEATKGKAITPVQMSASGGRTPYRYSLSGAPSGIRITESGGLITGTPRQTGTFSLTVTVTDEDNRTASMSFDMRVSPPLTVSSISDVVMDLGERVSVPVSVSGGRTPYRYSLSGNPSSISMSGSRITGTPNRAGTPYITVTVRDADGRTDSESFTIRVAPELNVASISDVVMDLGERVTVPVSVSGGRRPYQYSLSGNPSGVSLSGSSITIMPTQAGTPYITVTVRDADGRTDSESFTISVAPELNVASISDVVMDLGERVSVPVSVSGGRTPYRYSLSGNPEQHLDVRQQHHGHTHTGGDFTHYGDGEGRGWQVRSDKFRLGRCRAYSTPDGLVDIGCDGRDPGRGHHVHTGRRTRRADALCVFPVRPTQRHLHVRQRSHHGRTREEGDLLSEREGDGQGRQDSFGTVSHGRCRTADGLVDIGCE